MADGDILLHHPFDDYETSVVRFLREAARPLLLIAGGTGLAPILSILRTMRESGSSRPTHLVYGVSTAGNITRTMPPRPRVYAYRDTAR